MKKKQATRRLTPGQEMSRCQCGHLLSDHRRTKGFTCLTPDCECPGYRIASKPRAGQSRGDEA
jgi:hypothetical protein